MEVFKIGSTLYSSTFLMLDVNLQGAPGGDGRPGVGGVLGHEVTECSVFSFHLMLTVFFL